MVLCRRAARIYTSRMRTAIKSRVIDVASGQPVETLVGESRRMRPGGNAKLTLESPRNGERS